ncbi:MAG TPA: tetratricopeptide repeat protein [Caulobacteraceae bacterium]|nr:tetratricopeptide repeat protein [Caulobacteraceae bacterium]
MALVAALLLAAATPALAQSPAPTVAQIQADVNAGQAAMTAGKPAEAEPLLARASESAAALWGASSPDAGRIGVLWGDSVLAQKRPGEAGEIYRLALLWLESSAGPDSPEVALALNNLALAVGDQGADEEADALLRRSLRLRLAAFGPTDPATLITSRNLAVTLRRLGRPDEAASRFDDILSKQLAAQPPDRAAIATTLHDYAVTLITLNHAARAEYALREAVTIRESLFGAAGEATLESVARLAEVKAALGRFDDAIAMQRRVLASLEKAQAPPMVLARAHASLGDTLVQLGRYAEAEDQLVRALDINETECECNQPERLSLLTTVADLLLLIGKVAEAEGLLRVIIAERERIEGPTSPALVHELYLLAIAAGERDRGEATRLLARATEVANMTLPAGHIERLTPAAALGAALAADRRPQEALPILRTSARELAATLAAGAGMDKARKEQLRGFQHIYRLHVTAAWDRASGL